MKFKKSVKLLGIALVISTAYFFLMRKKVSFIPIENAQKHSLETAPAELGSNPESSPTNDIALPPATLPAIATSPSEEESAIELTAGNFSSFVNRCFQGEKCKLGESPLKMYQDFKIAGNRRKTDNLISFMRSQLKDTVFKTQYKDLLKQIITDFYPPDDLPFELAAFYNYAGDLQKSLALYQDLEKRQQNNPGRRPAPKLNIANTFYDLHRYSEALPYYQQALQSYLSGSQQSAAPSQSQMITFIEERIAECKSKM